MKEIKIGTRGSPLALVQACMVKDLLNCHWPELTVSLEIIKTSGDWKPADGETRLPAEGNGKALFAKELEEHLLAGTIDIAVHSMKDMDSTLPEGLEIACVLPRENPQDAILLRNREGELKNLPISEWPKGTIIGTTSLRRQAMLLAQNVNLKIQILRGNVETRISKVRGELVAQYPDLDATLLAVAGLNRLGLEGEIDAVFSLDDMCPAAAQGTIGIEILSKNSQLNHYLKPLNCTITQRGMVAERAVLKMIGASCHTPIGAYAAFNSEGLMTLKAVLLSCDGVQKIQAEMTAMIDNLEDAEVLGRKIGDALLKNGAKALLDQAA